MAMGPVTTPQQLAQAGSRVRTSVSETPGLQRLLIGVAITFLTMFLFVPLVAVFVNAFSEGVHVFFAAISDPDALSAVRLTLLTAATSTPA